MPTRVLTSVCTHCGRSIYLIKALFPYGIESWQHGVEADFSAHYAPRTAACPNRARFALPTNYVEPGGNTVYWEWKRSYIRRRREQERVNAMNALAAECERQDPRRIPPVKAHTRPIRPHARVAAVSSARLRLRQPSEPA